MTTKLKKIEKSTWWICLFTCLFLVFSSCSPEQDFLGEQNDGYLHLSFSKSDTRADLNPDGSGSFSEGDKIGLYIDNGNEVQYRELTYSNGQWTPLLRRSEFGTGALQLSAHYPAIYDGTTPTVDFRVSTDQSQSGKAESDLLFARTTLDEGKYDAAFSFKHLMHRLKIKLEGATSNVTILARSKTAGNIDLLKGTTTVADGDFQWITPATNADGSLEVIIFPQTVAPYRTEEGLLKITTEEKEVRYLAPETMEDGNPLVEFETGKETSIRLQLKDAGNLEWANKTMWVYGIQAPEESAWRRLFPTINYTLYLSWKEEYGWYDVNKRNPSDLAGGIAEDGQMCWAAASSNLLHWWIDRNKNYIEQYVAQGKYLGPDYQYNAANAKTEDKQESQIFQAYLNSFINRAGYIDEGVNWFIHGIKPSAPTMTNPINNAGYFKDIFPDGVKLCKNIAGLGKETFNNAIKDALLNKKGIGVSIGPVRKSHAINVWGVEFDENGDISYIYLSDNNDRDQYIFWGYGCTRHKIVYATMPEGGTITGYKSGELDEPEDSYIPFNRLVTLDLGTEYFEAYFNNK